MTDRPIEMGEAIKIAQRMKNTFRAFEKMEEVLITLSQAESAETERKRRVEKLDKTIEVLNQEMEALREQVIETNKDSERKISEMQEEVETKKNQYYKTEKELTDSHAEFIDDLRKQRAKLAEEHNSYILGMRDKEKGIQGRVDTLNKSLNGLLDKVKKMGE